MFWKAVLCVGVARRGDPVISLSTLRSSEETVENVNAGIKTMQQSRACCVAARVAGQAKQSRGQSVWVGSPPRPAVQWTTVDPHLPWGPDALTMSLAELCDACSTDVMQFIVCLRAECRLGTTRVLTARHAMPWVAWLYL